MCLVLIIIKLFSGVLKNEMYFKSYYIIECVDVPQDHSGRFELSANCRNIIGTFKMLTLHATSASGVNSRRSAAWRDLSKEDQEDRAETRWVLNQEDRAETRRVRDQEDQEDRAAARRRGGGGSSARRAAAWSRSWSGS